MNSAHHSSIKRTPFKALFGTDPRMGLTSSSLPLKVFARLQSEDDLFALFANPSEEVLAQDPQPPPASAAPVPTSQKEITEQRKSAREAQLSQAERKVKRSRIDFKAAEEGEYVAVATPMVERGKGDPRNILGVIIGRSDNDLYTIAVKNEILTTKYSRNQFDISPQRLLTLYDVNKKTWYPYDRLSYWWTKICQM
ncbi:uncharacterized protein LOC125030380 [Penaeus chinensis]|uniref:uncharacterized protein LOC125030380 n=1 Tax=Penaeus chinensis TaxID=139456 RepID=UPI001FB73013|nr:uncharacterized protein LOC125030380 [Penaeus chinensis]